MPDSGSAGPRDPPAPSWPTARGWGPYDRFGPLSHTPSAISASCAKPPPTTRSRQPPWPSRTRSAACRERIRRPSRLAVPGQDSVQRRDRAGRSVAVGRGDLGGPPLGRIGHGPARGEVERRGDGHRLQVRQERGLCGPRGLRPDEFGDAVRVLLREAAREVDAERSGDLLPQELPRQQAGDPADHFADQESEGDRVVAGPGAGLPPGFGGRRPGAGQLPVVQLGQAVRLPETGQAGTVRQEVAYEDGLLARPGQYRATGAWRSSSPRSARMWAQSAVGPFVVDQAWTRVSRSQGAGPGLVGPAAPEVGHRCAVQQDGDGRAQLVAFGDVPPERLTHPANRSPQ